MPKVLKMESNLLTMRFITQLYMALQNLNQGERIYNLFEKESISNLTKDKIARDRDVFYHQALSTPVSNAISKVEGAYIFDTDGKKYMDLHGNGVHTVGYNNPFLIENMKNLIDSGLSFSPRRFTNEPTILLAEKLVEVSPNGLDKVLFCPGGSQAVEMAVMLAKLNTSRWQTLSFSGSFHGAGFQSVSIGADPHFCKGIGPLMPGAIHLELPSYYRNPWGWTSKERIDNEYLRQFRLQVESNNEIAAVISEPIFYNSTVPTKYYWTGVREICDQHGILLIFDEIYTAFGRTGKMFASEHFITPDILVIGKGFGGGLLPFAGIIGKSSLNSVNGSSIGHYTHEKSPLCSVIGNSVIDFVLSHNLLERALTLGGYLKERLLEFKDRFEIVGIIDGLGLNLSMELVKNKHSKERAYKEANLFLKYCLESGVSFKLIQGNIVNIKPSLVVNKEEIDFIISVFREGLSRLQTDFKK